MIVSVESTERLFKIWKSYRCRRPSSKVQKWFHHRWCCCFVGRMCHLWSLHRVVRYKLSIHQYIFDTYRARGQQTSADTVSGTAVLNTTSAYYSVSLAS